MNRVLTAFSCWECVYYQDLKNNMHYSEVEEELQLFVLLTWPIHLLIQYLRSCMVPCLITHVWHSSNANKWMNKELITAYEKCKCNKCILNYYGYIKMRKKKRLWYPADFHKQMCYIMLHVKILFPENDIEGSWVLTVTEGHVSIYSNKPVHFSAWARVEVRVTA